MALRLNGSSSGYVELDVPAAAGSHTLTLPDGGGSSGDYLRTDGSGGLSWAGVTTGKILQVVSATQSTEASRTSDSSRFDSGLTASITPSSTSSKVLILVTQSLYTLNGTSTTTGRCHLMRGATDLASFVQRAYAGNSTAFLFGQHITGHYMDSPASTSALTYKTQVNVDSSSSSTCSAQGNSETSFIILMEVAG
jgi:hypothetical protein